ncbi:hypothetical protein BGW42_004190 [Actinomortierella wolfii]|nr:hypothetical protein BGW42_004190 [Actinomortierella wolfii]
MTDVSLSGVILDINGSNGKAGVIKRGLEYDSKASSDAKLKYFAKVFKDPPNANDILNGRTESECSRDGSAGKGTRGTFRLFQFNLSCTNQEHIFRAMLYLRNHLPEVARLEDANHVFFFGKDGPSFKELAEGLAKSEPSLRGVTALALNTLYHRIVKDYQAYLELKPLLTGGMTLSSKCADLAHEIFDVHNMMRMRENRQQAAKSDTRAALVAQEEATTRRTNYAMLGGRSMGRHNLPATIPQPEETEADTDEQTMEQAIEKAVDTVDGNIRGAAHAHEARTANVVAVPHRLDREVSSTSESTDASPLSPYPMSHPRPSVRGSRKRSASAMRHQPLDLLVSRVNSAEEALRDVQKSINDIQECIKKMKSDIDVLSISATTDRGRLKTVVTNTGVLGGQIAAIQIDIDEIKGRLHRS